MSEFIRVTSYDGYKILINLAHIVRVKNRAETSGGSVIYMRDGYESTVKETVEQISNFIDRDLYE